MKNKIEKEFSRLELADYLENLARHLRSGKFEAGGRQWSVPDAFEAKIKHKEKKGRGRKAARSCRTRTAGFKNPLGDVPPGF